MAVRVQERRRRNGALEMRPPEAETTHETARKSRRQRVTVAAAQAKNRKRVESSQFQSSSRELPPDRKARMVAVGRSVLYHVAVDIGPG